MSSDYRIICLSHDPAIVVTDHMGEGSRTLEAALDELARDTAHTTCDVVIGQYSYPLVEVFCVPGRAHPATHFHRTPEATDVKWLRLLWAASVAPTDPGLTAAVEPFERWCWTTDRVHRLRQELGVDAEAPRG